MISSFQSCDREPTPKNARSTSPKNVADAGKNPEAPGTANPGDGNTNPGNGNTGDANPNNPPSAFKHDFAIDSCGKCHENKRPALPHPQNEDCISCHNPEKGWADIKNFSHEPKPQTCNQCHLNIRPKDPHPQDGDCASCHNFPSFAKVEKFSHTPPPGSCNTCHNPDRPKAPHVQTDDCVSCHKYPEWKTIASFKHDPKPSDCISCHKDDRPNNGEPHYTSKDCVSCHNYPSWSQASFSHIPKPTKCEECHTRPDETYRRAYPNVGTPGGFNPNNPNEPGSGHLVGLDCNVCHLNPAEGAKSWSFNHDTPTVPYCLPCHFSAGAREHGTAGNNRVKMSGFGNCYNCHRDYRKSRGRGFGD